MNVREFVDGLKGGVLREADVYKYLKDVDARALQALYDNVYIAALACIGVHGYDSDNTFRAASIIAKYAKSEYSLSVGYGEPDYTEPSKEEPQRDRMGVILPDELNNEAAKKYFARAMEEGLIDKDFNWKCKQDDLSYFAATMSNKLNLSKRDIYNVIDGKDENAISWQPFVELFGANVQTLKSWYSKYRNGAMGKPKNHKIIDGIFN